MTREEKFSKLAELFAQRAALDCSILEVIGQRDEKMTERAEASAPTAHKGTPKKKGKPWSRHYPECQRCGTTSVKHLGAGLCKKCYTPAFAMAVKKGIDVRGMEKGTRIKAMMGGSRLRNYECDDCHNTFQSKQDKLDITCPDCNSIHVSEI
jgi:Zn finger protein HypA/HybF involved in hydrogenase expression